MITLSAGSIARTNYFIQTKKLIDSQIARPSAPRIFIRDRRGLNPLAGPDGKRINQFIQKPAETKIKPIKVRDAKLMQSGSTIMTPSKTVLVSKSDLPTIKDAKNCFGTGMMNFPKVYGKDHYVEGQVKVKTRLPGEGIFKYVPKIKYDVRGGKFLFTLSDHLRIAREMSKCASNRGIVSHPKLTPYASIGGEIWFLPEGKAVHFNLNSGRFPSKTPEDLDVIAKYLLSLGYDKVYATPKDQRYGVVTPILYMLDHSSDGSGGKLKNE